MAGNVPRPKASILKIAPYTPGKSAAKGGGQVIKLSSNENALGPSLKAVAAYQQASATLHRYPDGQATLLKNALHEVLGFEPERVVCGAGSDELIHLLIQAYTNEGDEVLYSAHGFLMYPIYARACGAIPVTAPESANLTADVDALLAAVTRHTRMVFLANPNNPTGSYLHKGEIERLRAELPPNILLVLDGAYHEYVTVPDYSDGSELVRTTGNTVMLRTFSKAYGLSALRLGYGYMPPEVAEIINRIRGPFNVSSAAIAAGAAAVRDEEYIRQVVRHNTQWRDWLSLELGQLGLLVYPAHGNFILIKFPDEGSLTAARANEYLLNQGIIVREVANYGLPNCLRITIGLDMENKAVAAALTRFMRHAGK